MTSDLRGDLIAAIDERLSLAPAPGTMMPADVHIDLLLDLRLAVEHSGLLAHLEEEIAAETAAQRRRRVGARR